MPVGNVENGIVSLDMDWRPSDMAPQLDLGMERKPIDAA